MYVGNDGGLWRTHNARAATSQEECPIGDDPGPPMDIAWENMNNGYGGDPVLSRRHRPRP